MTRIEHILTELASVENRVDLLNDLLRHPNFGKLPAIGCQLLQRQFESTVDLAHVLRARLDLAERMGAPDVLEVRALGLEAWLTL